MDQTKPGLTFKSIIFWRFFVGLLIVLLFQRGAENIPHFVGRWLGTVAIVIGSAGLVSAIGYLFFTSWMKTRAATTFLWCSWALAALLLFGQWVIPDLMRKLDIASGTQKQDLVEQREKVQKPQLIPFTESELNSKTKPKETDWSQFVPWPDSAAESKGNKVSSEGQIRAQRLMAIGRSLPPEEYLRRSKTIDLKCKGYVGDPLDCFEEVLSGKR